MSSTAALCLCALLAAVAPSARSEPSSDPTARLVVAGALRQATEGALYAPGYVAIGYPGGDLPRDQGVCTDVVVRALREAGLDLQRLIHEDMGRRFASYPKRWGLTRPDPNVDHRRVPNQKCWLERHATPLPRGTGPEDWSGWQPGDLVYWRLDSGLDHCGVLSSRATTDGRPLVVHNLGVCREEDCLAAWPVTGHYRLRP